MKTLDQLPRPTLREGDSGPAVAYMQSLLPHDHDGDFGPITDQELRDYQRSRGLTVDGVCGPETWAALESNAPADIPNLPTNAIAAIMFIAHSSNIATYYWPDRGVAPDGYVQGIALAFAQSYMRLKTRHPAVIEMSQPNTNEPDTDALAWYAEEFDEEGMDNSKAGGSTLRHLYVLLMGLGMRESSGRHCEGRDMSASNVSSDTAEAGLFQTSYNAHVCSEHFDPLMDEFNEDGAAGFESVFANGVECSSSEWENYGSGRGYDFQVMCKTLPAFAVESCALVLRNLRQHYGPINRKEAEIRPEADDLFLAIQSYLESEMIS